MNIHRQLLLAGAIVSAAGMALSGVAPAPILLGDGIGHVTQYNPQAKSVIIQGQEVFLSADAAVSLELQLGQQPLVTGKDFDARFNVTGDGSGRRVIDSIYVFPMSPRQGMP